VTSSAVHREPAAPRGACAQAHLEAFYASLGFARISEVYDEDGIPAKLVWAGPKPKVERPKCDGCNPEADQRLFRRLANEVDAYLDGLLWEDA